MFVFSGVKKINYERGKKCIQQEKIQWQTVKKF